MKKVEKLIDPKFEEAFSCFMEVARQKVKQDSEKLPYVIDLEYEVGNRYVKINRTEEFPGCNKRVASVYCFVDVASGDILKAASYKAPAKHSRGSVYAADFGASAVGPYGANYIRG